MSAPALLFKAVRAGYSLAEIGSLWRMPDEDMILVLRGELKVDPVYLDYLNLKLNGALACSVGASLSLRSETHRILNREEFEMGVELLPIVYKKDVCVSLAFVDVDGLKEVNDSLGHRRGDDLISSVGSGLLSSVRPGDLCCRYGGDEFALLLPTKKPASSSSVTNILSSRLAHLNESCGASFSFGVTSGVVSLSSPIEDLRILLDEADRLMYQQKSAKKIRTEV